MSNVTSLAGQTKSRVPPTETSTSSAVNRTSEYHPHCYFQVNCGKCGAEMRKPSVLIAEDVTTNQNQ